ncbi:MAG: amylo-alpha-1,6-glucosidase [archaeon]
MMSDIAYEEAIRVIDKCSTPNGIFASGNMKGYNSVWARDSMITLLGASLTGKYREQFEKSLVTLAKHQDSLGQIPNEVDKFDKTRKPNVSFATIDSTLWFIIGSYVYAQRYGNRSLIRKHKKNIERAFLWLLYQDTGKDGMPEQQPTSDWQDAFPHKYGHCINTQALYYGALKLAGKKKEAETLKQKVNAELWDESRGFYLAYRWKNHQEFQEKGRWFDSLGNMLAIFFGVAELRQAKKILNHVLNDGIDKPYPVKTIYPPIEPGTPDWKEYYWADSAGVPEDYLNGGIWPFNGGFFVTCLAKIKNWKEANYQLGKLAEVNKLGNEGDWEFHEWVDWKGKPRGQSLQAWSAGAYIMAYHAVNKKEGILRL